MIASLLLQYLRTGPRCNRQMFNIERYQAPQPTEINLWNMYEVAGTFQYCVVLVKHAP